MQAKNEKIITLLFTTTSSMRADVIDDLCA